MSKFPQIWDPAYEAVPLDSEQESLGAGRIRDTKVEVRERMQQDHSWAGDDSDGYHLTVTLLTQTVDPTPTPAGTETAGVLYTKVVTPTGGSPNNELFYKDSLTNILQMTNQGVLNLQVPSGTVTMFAGPNAPNGWAFLRGQSVSTTGAYAALFAMFGYTYGGSGANFNLPDTQGRTVFGFDPGNATGRLTNPTTQATGLSANALGNTGGEQAHTMSAAELVIHNHTTTEAPHSHLYHNVTVTSGNGSGGNPQPVDGGTVGTSGATTGLTVNNAGGGAQSNVTPPGIVLNYIIKL